MIKRSHWPEDELEMFFALSENKIETQLFQLWVIIWLITFYLLNQV